MREVRIDLDVELSSHQLQKTGSNLFAVLVYQALRLYFEFSSLQLFVALKFQFHFISFSYNLGRVALQLVLVSKGPSIYFTIYFITLLKTKLKHIMNKIYRNTQVIDKTKKNRSPIFASL